MPKKNTSYSNQALFESEPFQFTNSAFELVNWSSFFTSKPTFKLISKPTAITRSKSSFATSYPISDKILALQTTRLSPLQISPLKINEQDLTATPSNNQQLKNEKLISKSSPFGAFNLGLHVGDSAEKVNHNRNVLKQLLQQKLSKQQLTQKPSPHCKLIEDVQIQWLKQVHGNEVVEVMAVNEQVITADASITRQKNIALAIMTADCLPILLSHKDGTEVAAIHGGWRPLATNIIEKTLDKMHSKPAELVAWLGPCIGKGAFEVGSEVKETFTQQGVAFNNAFIKQENGKYLADLQKIAQLQLQALGVSAISGLAECTYQETNKYYSYRKERVTGRMASIICRR
ncbi:MAG: peptidoglycan editing factor PgeF [Colwellia sp.]|uniref:peptidoglycan editing factor PgeF n=1 Tax=Colwellia sp. TaxID=56799 RepID=UPI001D659883|nr:peptidoglycan editing factor PgeF [Colwellia sp.]NQY50089.1 peptidoglycan editing factor PgeF [Colwellia sp.]